MKAYITIAGDRSVGIPEGRVTIDFEDHSYIEFDDYFDRQEIRSDLQSFFSNLYAGELVGLRFEDECPDCHKSRQPGSDCPNKDCITNIPDKEEEFERALAEQLKEDQEFEEHE